MPPLTCRVAVIPAGAMAFALDAEAAHISPNVTPWAKSIGQVIQGEDIHVVRKRYARNRRKNIVWTMTSACSWKWNWVNHFLAFDWLTEISPMWSKGNHFVFSTCFKNWSTLPLMSMTIISENVPMAIVIPIWAWLDRTSSSRNSW